MKDDARAPNLFTYFVNNPQMNGPKNVAPMAPHDIPSIATMESGFNRAMITDKRTKNTLENLIKFVSFLSEIFLLINPA